MNFKYIISILIFTTIIIFIFISCNGDPLGIEKNVIKIPLDTTTHHDTIVPPSPPAIVDSIYTSIIEQLFDIPSSHVDKSFNWNPKITTLDATIDTSVVPNRVWMNLTLELPDLPMGDRRERVKYVQIRMDSIIATGSYDLNNSDYKKGWSSIYIEYQTNGNVTFENKSGHESPLTIEFTENMRDNNSGWVKAVLTAKIDALEQYHELKFNGWFKLYYKLK